MIHLRERDRRLRHATPDEVRHALARGPYAYGGGAAGAAAMQGARRSRTSSEPAWSPLDLPGVFGIYECDDSQHEIDESMRIVTLHDQSPYQNDIGTSGEGARPLFLGPSEGILYDGAGDFSRALSTAAFGSQPTDMTVIAVGQLQTAGATTVHARVMNPSGTDRVSLGASAAGAPRFLTSGTGGAASVGTTSVLSAARVYWGRATFGATQECGVGESVEDTDTITITYADLDGGRVSIAGNSAGAGLVHYVLKALYLSRAFLTTDDFAHVVEHSIDRNWI